GQTRVGEARTPPKLDPPIPGMHVADGDGIARARERERLLPPHAALDRDGTVHLREAWRQPRMSPAGIEDAIRHRWAGREAATRAPGRRRASCRRSVARWWDR